MAAMCHLWTHAPQQTRLFDHLIGAGEQRRQPARAGGARQRGPSENASALDCGTPEHSLQHGTLRCRKPRSKHTFGKKVTTVARSTRGLSFDELVGARNACRSEHISEQKRPYQLGGAGCARLGSRGGDREERRSPRPRGIANFRRSTSSSAARTTLMAIRTWSRQRGRRQIFRFALNLRSSSVK
jgi:hypothetical protein